MTNEYLEESRCYRRRALIPLIILLLCVSGMFSIGYCALISDVTNETNLIAGEGLDAKFVNEEGNILKEGEFGSGANEGKGANMITYGTIRVNDYPPNYQISEQNLELGKAVLSIQPSAGSDIKFVKIWYDLVWTGIDPETEYDMLTTMTIGKGDMAQTITRNELTAPFEISNDCKCTFTLNGSIAQSMVTATKPTLMEYSITIHIEPVI